MKPNQLTVTTTAISFAFLSAVSVQAAELSYDFGVTFVDGNLVAQTFTGTFTIDSTVSSEFFVPAGSTLPGAGGLLSWMIEIDGESFDIEDDENFPNFPEVVFDGGGFDGSNFESMDFTAEIDDDDLNIFFAISGINVLFRNGNDESPGTIITPIILQPTTTPEPSNLLALLGLGGLLALFTVRVF